MADHYTLIERHEGSSVSLELWGGRVEVRAGYHQGDLIELYGEDERDDARLHCKALNHDLAADLTTWLATTADTYGVSVPQPSACDDGHA